MEAAVSDPTLILIGCVLLLLAAAGAMAAYGKRRP